MNLFIDAHVFDDPFQGSRTYLKGLYSEIITNYRSVNFFFGAADTENIRSEFGVHENVAFIRYWSKNKFIRLLINIPFVIIKYRIDISHYQYIVPLFRFSREILTIHDVLFLDFPDLFPATYRLRNRLLFRFSARRADFLLTVSEYSKNKISEHFCINKKNIHIIPNGIADDYFLPAGLEYDLKEAFGIDKYLLYVSRIEPRKNHHLLVKAFSELNLWKDSFKLIFIGYRALPCPELDDCIQKLPDPIRDAIMFIDAAHSDELKTFYHNCSLFVYPSLAEGFGIPPLEAAAAGAPVLCSSATAMKEFSFFEDRLFDPASLRELKEKIIRYLNSAERNNIEIIKSVKKKYNWKNSSVLFSKIIFKGL